jgi:hypothetical protein
MASDADFDGNGVVGFSDFVEFAAAFGSGEASTTSTVVVQ